MSRVLELEMGSGLGNEFPSEIPSLSDLAS